ncbi:hypothetical protein LCGC14_1605700 [marine sediment metagenome]|uniref:Uncharacterized protein n=1 Tax=marine sediment metagenome TaxID=412755 RepID=A0A0F9KQJ1_9ZZZZ
MRKYIWVLLVLSVLCMAATTTRITSYQAIDTQTSQTNETDLTGNDFVITRNTATDDIDLLKTDGAGKVTYAANLEFVFSAGSATNPNNATGTVIIYGAADYGPWERITSLAVTVGTASATLSTTEAIRWVDTLTRTDIASTTVLDSGNNRMARLNFVNPGYRFLRVLWTEKTGNMDVDLGNATMTTYLRWHSK